MEEEILNYLPTVMFRGTPCNRNREIQGWPLSLIGHNGLAFGKNDINERCVYKFCRMFETLAAEFRFNLERRTSVNNMFSFV